MSGFAIPENWGRKNHQSLKPKNQESRKGIDGVGRRRVKEKRESKHGLGICREDMEIVRRRQNGRSIITGGPIYDFHHEPPIKDLCDAGVKVRGGGIEVVFGVENVVHALLHYAAYKLTNDKCHLDEVTSIMCRYDNDGDAIEAEEYFDKLVSGPEMQEALNFVRQRRNLYHLPC